MIRLNAVSRTYAGPTPVHALRDVSFELRAGDFASIAGPSGSGKSTLLNVLGLLDRPSTGSYFIDEIDVSKMSDRERTRVRARTIGFVFQAFHLLPGRTAVENVALGEVYGGWRAAGRTARARESLSRVGMSHREGFAIEQLSGGEKQRVAIARALMGHPPVLLCDEPTGNLDSENGSALLSLIGDLNTSGMTVIIVTHDSAVSAATPVRIHLRDGKVLAIESADGREHLRAATAYSVAS